MGSYRLVLLGGLLGILVGTAAGQTEEAKVSLTSRTTAAVSSPVTLVSCKVQGAIEDGVCRVINKLADGTCQVIEKAADGVCEVGGELVDLFCHVIGAVKSICPPSPPGGTPVADPPANTAAVTPAVTTLFTTDITTIITTQPSASETVTTPTSATTQYPDATDIPAVDPSTASYNEITDIPSETSDWAMPEYSSTTAYINATEFFPGYPNYTTTGRCGAEPPLCCAARDDSCRRINCYCDEYCNRPSPDCCQDYFDACHGGQIVPYYNGTGPITDYTFTGSTVVPTAGTTSATPSSSTVQPTTGSTTDASDWTTDQSTSEGCIPTVPGRTFPTMCSGQRKNVIRNCDLYGCGNYGGPRGHRYLKGVDIVCHDGFTVYAPFNGTIQSVDMCYGDVNDKPSDDGFMFIGSGLCVRIFNVKLDEESGWIRKGCRLGTLMPMRTQYPRITSHIHIQKCDLSDPTGLISEAENHHHSCTDPQP